MASSPAFGMMHGVRVLKIRIIRDGEPVGMSVVYPYLTHSFFKNVGGNVVWFEIKKGHRKKI